MSTSVSSDRIIALETGKCQRGTFYKVWVWDFEKQLLVLGLEMTEGEERSLHCGRDDTLGD